MQFLGKNNGCFTLKKMLQSEFEIAIIYKSRFNFIYGDTTLFR